MKTTHKVSTITLAIAIAVYYYYSSLAKGRATSVIVQALHFLARPHVTPARAERFEPIQLPSAWNGSFMSQHPHLWTDILTDDDKTALTNAIRHFQNLKKPLEELTVNSNVNDFPLSSSLQEKVEKWKHHLSPRGYGFYAIKGVPVDQWTLRQSEIFFFALGKYLGTPGAQDTNGTLLGHVKSVGYADDKERPYRQTVDIRYHCDGADVVGLLCIHPAKEGGISRIISSVSVYNRLLQHHKGQEYAAKLTDEVFSAVQGKTFAYRMKLLPFTPLKIDQMGVLRSFWNEEYYLKAYKFSNGSLTDIGRKDPLAVEAVETYDGILAEDMKRGYVHRGNCSDVDEDTFNDCVKFDPEDVLGLDMVLEKGDIQLVSNHFILHARTEFVDYTDDEIAEASKIRNLEGENVSVLGKRELYRLWLTQSTDDFTWEQYLSKQIDLLKVFSSFIRGLVIYR